MSTSLRLSVSAVNEATVGCYPEISNKQNTDRSLLVNRLHGSGEQRRDRQRADLRALLRLLAERNRIRHHHFLEPRLLDALDRLPRKDGMRGAGRNAGRAVIEQRLSALHQRSRGVDQV